MSDQTDATAVSTAPEQPHPLVEFWQYFRANRGAVTGLVLITDDGRWSFSITRPESDCPKTYRVNLSKPISADAETRFAQGLRL